MTLYETIREYSREMGHRAAADSNTPDLGESLSLFHSSLVESGLDHEGPEESPRLTAPPSRVGGSELSHFIVAFLPFNSMVEESEINSVLFEVYSFFRWLDKNKIPHGLSGVDLMKLMKDLSAGQERCLKLSHLLDHESELILKDPPVIVSTINDVFSVTKIIGDIIYLRGKRQQETYRLRLPDTIIPFVELNDNLDLVLGDTSEKWVLLEAGQVFPTPKPV